MLACVQVRGSKTARMPFWPPRGQQVSHQKWILGIRFIQTRKVHKRGIHPDFETQDRRHQKSKTGVSVAHKQDWCPQKKIQPFFFQNRRSITNLFCTRGQWAGTACACSGSFELDCRVSWRRFRTSLFRNTSPSSLRWRRHSSRDGRWWTGSRSSPSVRV